jgi:acetyltransferase-like isoleucine patch superfamily enzyme
MILGKHSYFLGTDHGIETKVGNYSSIAGGTYIHGPDNHACVFNRRLVSTFDLGQFGVDFTRSGMAKKLVEIGNDVWIGEYAQILSGVKIYDGVIIGAHSVVGKDIPPYSIAVGNPIVIKSFRFPPEIVNELLNIKWWDWEDNIFRERLEDFKDVYKFVEKYGKKS